MKAKRFLALILALVMALSLVACGDSGKTPAADGDSNGDGDSSFPKMTWTAATSGAEGSNFDVGLEKFSELLQEKTNGAVKLDIYCSDQLTNGNQADSIQANIDGTPILVSTYESWGVDYTTAAWAEVYTGLQTKLYDGQENPIAVADASSIQEVQKYVTAWTANYGIMFMVMNGDLYNSLSDELKAIVDECAKEACTYQIQYTRDQCDSALQKWIDDYGIEVYEMTPENAELFRAKIQPVYTKFAQYNELIDLLK